MATIVSYKAQPGQDVYYVFEEESVEFGLCCQVNIEIYENSDEVIVEEIKYLVLPEGANSGTVEIKDENLFTTLAEAANRLQAIIDPDGTPVATFTPTPTPTLTSSITPTLTPTDTPAATITPSPTPTVTPTPSS